MICNNCGEKFDAAEAVTLYDDVPYRDGMVEMPAGIACPCCKSDDIEESLMCECGEVVAESKSEDGLCQDCTQFVYNNFKTFYDIMLGTEKQRQYFCDHFDEWV